MALTTNRTFEGIKSMSSFNKVILVGNLTRDPQTRHTPSGSAVAEISLACSRSWFDKATNSRKESVDYIDVTLFGKTAEVAESYLRKGRQVLIEGRLQLDTWDDKQTGKKRQRLRVIGESMQMLGSRGDSGGNQQQASHSPQPAAASVPDDAVPF